MAEKGRYVYEWPRPMVTVDAMVFTEADSGYQIVLIQRGKEPFKGSWALPGGFVEMDEQLHTAAKRELKEETGIKNVNLKQLHTFGTPGRDPRGRQITVVYAGIISGDNQQIRGGDDADRAKWFNIEDLPSSLAFDHAEVIEYGIKELRKGNITKSC
jgi:8-oxo-dGTP diphosphatase